ncbi:MAG: ferredoxin family protein [Planctomycetota bacterium]|nr:ferredoxin family protein [Planctomycetota bacterium]
MSKKISVIVSQGQSRNPAKRNLEESIVTSLMMESEIEVTVVPHLYDLKADGTGMLALKSIPGNMVVLSWLFERAARWVLDRNGIHGHAGVVELENDSDDDEPDGDEPGEMVVEEKERVIDSRPIPNRHIYCLDFRVSETTTDFIQEIKRIQTERSVKVVPIGLGSKPADPPQIDRFEQPTNTTSLAKDGTGLENNLPVTKDAQAILNRIEETSSRRWYPVIDYSRCTNCMECIDFCLFGVYGVDRADAILVEQPDNCRKGCPACSRVCPENAIIFPQHKTPAIAGSNDVNGSLKIDLSKLFGAPEAGKSAEEIAAIERDEQLLAAGRDAVGRDAVEKPRPKLSPVQEPKDELYALVDELDELDL